MAERVVELFFAEMSDALVNGDRVKIRGLAAKKPPFFKCGKELKERVDYPEI